MLASSRVARFDGTAWRPLGPGFAASVYALAKLPDGTLGAGGAFLTTGSPQFQIAPYFATWSDTCCGPADFNGDGDVGTDADIGAFFACLGGNCCRFCGSADFNGDGDVGTDAEH